MMITAKFLKSSLSEHHPLTCAAKTFLRSSTCLTAVGAENVPLAFIGVKGCGIHTTSSNQYPGQDWRKMRGKPANPNAYGPLTDGPDYSFLDGRPTPVGVGKLKRAVEQKEITAKIMKLSGEVDFAVAHHNANLQNEKEKREHIIRNKLKKKGSIPPEVLT